MTRHTDARNRKSWIEYENGAFCVNKYVTVQII